MHAHDLRDEVHRMDSRDRGENGGRDYGGYRGHSHSDHPVPVGIHGRSRSRSRERRGPYPVGGAGGGSGGRYTQPPPVAAGRYADGPAPYYDSRGPARHSDDRGRGDSRYPPAAVGGRGHSRPSQHQWDERETSRGPSIRGGGSDSSAAGAGPAAGVTVFPNPHYPPKHAHHTLNSLKREESVESDTRNT